MRRFGSMLITAGGGLAVIAALVWYAADEVRMDGEPHADLAARIGIVAFCVALLVAGVGALLRRRATLAQRSNAELSDAVDSRR